MSDNALDAPTHQPSGRAAAIVVAAGQGIRMGGQAKVLRLLAGKPIVAHVLDAIDRATTVSEIVLVANEQSLDEMRRLIGEGGWTKPISAVVGGVRRQDSVAAGLAAIGDENDVVAIHDGARPFASPDLFDAVIAAAWEHGAAIAAVPVVDTLKRVANGRVAETLDRAGVWAAQTPQAARASLLRMGLALDLDVTDEAMLMEAIGQPVAVVDGSRLNLKVTQPLDLVLADAIALHLAGKG